METGDSQVEPSAKKNRPSKDYFRPSCTRDPEATSEGALGNPLEKGTAEVHSDSPLEAPDDEVGDIDSQTATPSTVNAKDIANFHKLAFLPVSDSDKLQLVHGGKRSSCAVVICVSVPAFAALNVTGATHHADGP